MPGPLWTAKELELLEQLSAQGHGPKAIAAMGVFGTRSKNAIAKAISRAQLADKTRSAKTKQGIARRLRGERRRRYLAFLRSPEGRAKSSTEIAKQWGLTPRTVREHRAKYDAEHSYGEVSDSTREQQRKSAYNRHNARQEVEEIERRKLQLRLEKEGCTDPKVPCRDCGDEFFHTKTFFAVVRSRRKGQVYSYVSRRCLFCAAKKAAEKWRRGSTKNNRKSRK